jgi:hypothetical protein
VIRATLAAALLLLPAAAAQDEPVETAQARLLRDQARVGQRLTGLRDKMERLAQRYEDEGRTRNAQLLREALARYDEQQLPELQRQAQLGLEQGSLSTVERQDSLADGLESVYAILRDRRDAEDLARQANLAREGLEQLQVLAANQRRLLQSTHAATDRPSELVDEALARALELAEALAEAADAARTGQQAERQLGDAQLAAELAQQQRGLATDPSPNADTPALLQAALDLLRERLAAPGGTAEDGAGVSPELLQAAEAARDRAREAADEAASAMQDAHASLQAAEQGRPAPSAPSSGEAPAPGESGTQGEQGSEAQGQQGQPSAAQPEQAGGQPGAEATPRPAESPALSQAREQMGAAAERLEEVRDELDRSERSLAAARNRAHALAQSSFARAQQDGERLDDLAQRLEAVQPQSGPELLDRTRELLEQLARAGDAAQAGQMGVAGERAGQAQASLDQLIEQLQRRAREATDEARPAPTPEDLVALADRQAELERSLRELMSRLKELPDQQFQEPAGRAQGAMQQAQSALRRGDSAEGATREEEAAEQLEQAARQLSGESSKYERLRQDEVLFRLEEDLTALLEQQRGASAETAEIDGARGEGERLSRSQRRALGRLADAERDLSTRAEALRTALEADGALAFELALAQSRDDLVAVADKLDREQTGGTVALLQGDVEQRLSDLLAVLEAERERRREQLAQADEQGQQSGGQQGGEEALVPTVAELLLIQRLEQAALARLDAFLRSAPEEGEEDGWTDADRDLLERWSSEHQRVTELFRRKFEDLPMPEVQPVHPELYPPLPPDEGEGGP